MKFQNVTTRYMQRVPVSDFACSGTRMLAPSTNLAGLSQSKVIRTATKRLEMKSLDLDVLLTNPVSQSWDQDWGLAVDCRLVTATARRLHHLCACYLVMFFVPQQLTTPDFACQDEGG